MSLVESVRDLEEKGAEDVLGEFIGYFNPGGGWPVRNKNAFGNKELKYDFNYWDVAFGANPRTSFPWIPLSFRGNSVNRPIVGYTDVENCFLPPLGNLATSRNGAKVTVKYIRFRVNFRRNDPIPAGNDKRTTKLRVTLWWVGNSVAPNALNPDRQSANDYFQATTIAPINMDYVPNYQNCRSDTLRLFDRQYMIGNDGVFPDIEEVVELRVDLPSIFRKGSSAQPNSDVPKYGQYFVTQWADWNYTVSPNTAPGYVCAHTIQFYFIDD